MTSAKTRFRGGLREQEPRKSGVHGKQQFCPRDLAVMQKGECPACAGATTYARYCRACQRVHSDVCRPRKGKE